MENHKIEPHRITKPIQLMAVWFIALLLIDSAFLTAAVNIHQQRWLSPLLAISAVAFVPLFLLGVFLMQTVFREQLQEDQYYSEWLERQEKAFGDFRAENTTFNPRAVINNANNVRKSNLDDLEEQRKECYRIRKGLFIVHAWRPSMAHQQFADIVIWLNQHGEGPLSQGAVEKVEYQLGPKFFKTPQVKTNADEQFKLEVSAYGPMLCLARVFLRGETEPIVLERYIDFGEVPSKTSEDDQTAAGEATS